MIRVDKYNLICLIIRAIVNIMKMYGKSFVANH